eukprot:TRINITY_DN31924_c0_g1_i1.p1 TRINITY_DN31924_c0_g1~~TRINITY_DN31924_c0_g1_i1.p1  ORF type:complete len:550 (-),score=122.70 TRINITY_DN31924_c0_g1_i1:4-1653(-)
MFGFLKDKSSSLISTYKHDLGEFARQLKQETGEIVRSAPNAAVPLSLDWESRRETYAEPIPLEEAPLFAEWEATFDLPRKTDEIATILDTHPAIAKLHAELVPAHIKYTDFWTRYFFHQSKSQKEFEKRQILQSINNADEEDDADFEWGDEGETETPADPSPMNALGEDAATLRQINSSLQEELATLQQTLAMVNADRHRLAQEFERTKAALLEAHEQERRLLQERISGLNEQKHTLSGQKAAENEVLESLRQEKDALWQRLADTKQSESKIAQEKGELEAALAQCSKELADAKSFTAEREQQLTRLFSMKESEDLTADQLRRENVQLKADSARMVKQLEASAGKITALEQAIQAGQEENVQLKIDIARACKQRESSAEVSAELQKLRVQLSQSASQAEALRVENERLKADIGGACRDKEVAMQRSELLQKENTILKTRIDDMVRDLCRHKEEVAAKAAAANEAKERAADLEKQNSQLQASLVLLEANTAKGNLDRLREENLQLKQELQTLRQSERSSTNTVRDANNPQAQTDEEDDWGEWGDPSDTNS